MMPFERPRGGIELNQKRNAIDNLYLFFSALVSNLSRLITQNVEEHARPFFLALKEFGTTNQRPMNHRWHRASGFRPNNVQRLLESAGRGGRQCSRWSILLLLLVYPTSSHISCSHFSRLCLHFLSLLVVCVLLTGGSSSVRKWLPYIAFIVGAAATVGYYESSAAMSPPVTLAESLSANDSVGGSSSLISFDEVEGSSSASSSSSSDPTLRELEAARDALFTAQKLADQRAAEAR
jgi:hypothetical protein